MADEHRFSADVEGPGIPSDKKSRWQSCLIGCLVAFVILFVVAILIAFWVSRNWREWTANVATEGIRQVISESQLPADEQQQVMVQVDRLGTAFRENKLSMEQVAKLSQMFADSPLIAVFGASILEKHYIAISGLSPEEKAASHQTLQRFIRGSIDEKITKQGIDAAMVHVATRKGGGDDWQLREKLTDQEIRAFLAEAKKQADEAGIPEQPADVDVSEEFKKIVDEALAAPA
jgi:hypothetical protein